MRPESRKDQRAAFTAALRADGWTWEEIAEEFQRQERCSPLAGLRLARGMSQQDVANAYNKFLTADPEDKPVDFRRVSRWELWPHGGCPPPLDALNRLAQIFQVRAAFLFEGEDHRHLDAAYQSDPDSPLLTEAIARSTTSPDQRQGATPSPGGGSALVLHPSQLAEFRPGPPGQRAGGQAQSRHLFVLHGSNPMERRAVLAAIASLPGVSLLPGQPGGSTSLLNPEATEIIRHAIERPDKVGPKALAPIGELIMGYRRLDDTLGARYVTEPVTAFLWLVRNILPAAEPKVRQPLFSLAASAAQLAGWLAVDASDHERARDLYDQAIEWATAGDDSALVAYLWCCRSDQARTKLDPLGAVSAAEAARRIAAHQNVTLRAWAEKTASWAYALAGDLDETIRAMDAAAELLDSADPGDAPSWLYHFQPEFLFAERGSALADAGQGMQAAELLDHVIGRLPASFVRHRGFYMAHQATALWVAGDPRNACTIGTKAVLIGRQTGSARTIQKVGRLHRSFDAKTAQLPEVRELSDLLREIPPA